MGFYTCCSRISVKVFVAAMMYRRISQVAGLIIIDVVQQQVSSSMLELDVWMSCIGNSIMCGKA
jgi:hypothetical protein